MIDGAAGRMPQVALLHALMLFSGMAGLGYQMVWTRMLVVGMGHEIVSVLAVIAAFFAGLALGAYALRNRIRSTASPARWYAALELMIGSWALLMIPLTPMFHRYTATLAGATPSAFVHWALAFGGSFVLLLPATMAMGATLPAMERIVSRLESPGRTVAGLYAANTFGAVCGTLLATFALAPALGFAATVKVLAFVNLACAAGVLALAPAAAGGALRTEAAVGGPSSRLLLILFATGLFGIGFEVLIVRVLSQVLENTVYTFASVLAVYLMGTALGAAWYQARAARLEFERGLAFLLQLAASTCLSSVVLLWFARDLHRLIIGALGAGEAAAIAAEMGIAAIVFLGPTLVMGALFAHLAQAAQAGLGRALAVNTLGAALAPFLFGVVLLPALGAKTALVLVAAAYLLLVPYAASRRLLFALPAVVAAALLLAAPALRLVTVPPGGKLLRYVDGVMASVAVVQDASGARHLKIDERFTMGGTATRFSDRRQAHLPLLLHGAPRDALFLGLGPGMTFAAAAEHPDLQATGVELVPEILPLLDLFDPIFANARGDRARLRVLSADARRYVNATADRYDVIVADLFHPSRDGAGALYTVEHFTAVRDRLRESGLFCQWLPLYQLDLPTLRAIVRTFVAVYPQAQAYLAHYSLGMPILGLIARREPTQYSPGWVARRMQDARLAEELRGTRLDTDFALFGGLLATAESLRRFAGDGPVNTDDYPLVTFQAPGFVYRAQAPPWRRLLCLLDALSADPAAALALAADASGRALHHRLQRYWTARDAFLRAGVGVVPSEDARALLAQTREPLLRVVRMSEDFDAAYDPLLGMARALFESDPEMTLALLRELESANPAREDARSLRLELFGG